MIADLIAALRFCVRIAPDRRAALAIGALSLVSVATFAAPAPIVARVVDDAVDEAGAATLACHLAILAAVGIVGAAAAAWRSYEVGRASELLLLRLRERTLRRLLSFPLPF